MSIFLLFWETYIVDITYIICEDMNFNLLKISENPSYNVFYENLTAHSFLPLITLPTRLSDTCDTLIDNIFTNNSDQHHTNCILTRVVSDHQMTCCMLSKNTIEKNTNLHIHKHMNALCPIALNVDFLGNLL